MSENTSALSTYHLSSGIGRYQEPARNGFFELVIENLGSLLKPGVYEEVADETDYVTDAQETIRLNVISSSVPHPTVQAIEIRRGNSVVKYSGTPSWDPLTVTVQDMIGSDSKTALEAWFGLCYNVLTDKGGRAINYKRNVTLIEYTPDWKQVRYWDLIGCWISGLSEDNYDMSNGNSAKTISVTLQFDRAIPHLPDID